MKNKEYRIQDTDQINLSAERSVSETVCQQSGPSGEIIVPPAGKEAGLPTIVGITGGIGSGKSTIARALAARGYAVYDCDKEAKRIIVENAEVRKAIIGLLGTEAFTASPEHPFTGIYNTSYVAQRVFAEPELLARLNAIVHPAVKEDILQHYEHGITNTKLQTRSHQHAVTNTQSPTRSYNTAQPVLFIESAILYEAGLDEICDKIIVVEAPEEVRIERTIQRDYNGEATEENINKVRARIQAQKTSSPLPGGPERGFILINDGRKSIDELAEEIITLLS